MTRWESLKHGLSSALEALLPAKTAQRFSVLSGTLGGSGRRGEVACGKPSTSH